MATSRPSESTLEAATLRAILRQWPVARLAVNRAQRPPWSVPVVFAPWGGALWSPFDGKPKRAGPVARAIHIERERVATLLLDEYAEDWSALWWVRLEVSAALHRLPLVAPHRHPGARALLEKYPQYRTTNLFRDAPVLMELRTLRVDSWASAGFERLRSRFVTDPPLQIGHGTDAPTS